MVEKNRKPLSVPAGSGFLCHVCDDGRQCLAFNPFDIVVPGEHLIVNVLFDAIATNANQFLWWNRIDFDLLAFEILRP